MENRLKKQKQGCRTQKKETSETIGRRTRRKVVIHEAKAVAKSILLRLKEGGMVDAFAHAGMHYMSQAERGVYDKLDQLQMDVMMDPENDEK